jgi:DNA-binding transcriptional LysR family regulator
MVSFSVSKFDIKHLRTFADVVDAGGIMAAAHRSGIILSTISRNLSDLEERLGYQLCRRGRAGFSLTPQGKEVHRATIELLSRIHLFEQQVQETKKTVGGKFNLGLINNVISNQGAGFISTIAQMHSEFPDLGINISIHDDPMIDVLVRDRQIDIGVTAQPARLPSIEYKPAFFEEHHLYISTKSPHFEVSKSILSGSAGKSAGLVPYIARSFEAEIIASVERKLPLFVTGTGDGLESILASVSAGLGCAIMPRHFVETFRRDEIVELPVKECPLRVQLFFAYRSDRARQPAIHAFLTRFKAQVEPNR